MRPSIKNNRAGLRNQLIRLRERLRRRTRERDEWTEIAFKDLDNLYRVAKVYKKEHNKLLRVRMRLDKEKNDICTGCFMPSPSMCRHCPQTINYIVDVSMYFERCIDEKDNGY